MYRTYITYYRPIINIKCYSCTPMTYVFVSPDGIDLWFDFAIVVKTKECIDDRSNILVAILFEHQLTQMEPGYRLVLVVQFDWTDLVHLPPLQVIIIINIYRTLSVVKINSRPAITSSESMLFKKLKYPSQLAFRCELN